VLVLHLRRLLRQRRLRSRQDAGRLWRTRRSVRGVLWPRDVRHRELPGHAGLLRHYLRGLLRAEWNVHQSRQYGLGLWPIRRGLPGVSVDPTMHRGHVRGRLLQWLHRQHGQLPARHHQPCVRHQRVGVRNLYARRPMHPQPMHHRRMQRVRGQHRYLSDRHHQRELRNGRRQLPDMHRNSPMHQRPVRHWLHRMPGFDRRLPGGDEQLRLRFRRQHLSDVHRRKHVSGWDVPIRQQ
jgi:hypothetical protein